MYYVYVIKSNVRSYIYVGLTSNIQRRFQEHLSGKNKTTKAYSPFSLIHSEKFSSRPEARVREKYLKSGAGKEWIKRNFLK